MDKNGCREGRVLNLTYEILKRSHVKFKKLNILIKINKIILTN